MTVINIHTKRLLFKGLPVALFCLVFYNMFVFLPPSSSSEYHNNLHHQQGRFKANLKSDERERRQVFDEKLASRLETMNLQMDANKASMESVVDRLSELQRLQKSMAVQQKQYVNMQ